MGVFDDQGQGQPSTAGGGQPVLRIAPPNPFDFGEAAKGVDPGILNAFQTARQAWAVHNKKMMTETIAALDREIGNVQGWAQVLQQALDLAQQLVGAATNTVDHDKRMATTNELSNGVAQTQSLAANLQQVRNGVPFLGNLVARLLGGINIGV